MLPDITFQFSHSHARIGLAAALLLFGLFLNWWLYRRGDTGSRASIRKWLFLPRTLVVLLISLLLMAPTLKVGRRQEVRASYALLLDNSLSMDLPASEKSGDTTSRSSEVRKRLEQERFFETIMADSDVDFYTFSSSLSSTARDSLFMGPRREGRGNTDISEALQSLRETNPEMDGIIVVTDGRLNAGGDPRLQLRADQPVLFIGVGENTERPDIDISEVDLPAHTYEGSPVPFLVSLRISSDKTDSIRIRINEGEDLRDVIPILLEAGEYYTDVTFSLEGVESGRHIYTLTVEALDGETFLENNRRHATIDVLSTVKKVLLLSTAPDWDMSFLARTLRNLKYLSVDILMSNAGREEWILISDQGGVGTGDTIMWGGSFNSYDILVLHGSITDLVRPEITGALDTFREPGKGCILQISGDPEKMGEVKGVWADLVPWKTPSSAVLLEGRYDVVPPVADPTGLTILSPHEGENMSIWSSLPPLTGSPDLSSQASMRADVTTILRAKRNDGEEFPALAVEDHGGFRIASFLGKGFWRWSFHMPEAAEDAQHYRKLIGSLAMWVAAGVEKKGIRIEPERPLFLLGEAVEFHVDGDLSVGRSPYLTLTDRNGDVTSDTLFFDPEEVAGKAELLHVAPGDYRFLYGIRGEESSGGGSFHVDSYSREYSNPEPDINLLRRLGTGEGGQYVHIDSIMGAIVGDSKAYAGTRDRIVSTYVITRTPFLYVMILICLTVELFLRKKEGFS